MPRPRATDPKVRKLIAKIERLSRKDAGPQTKWEKGFLTEVAERLRKFGSAFADEEKGSLDESLSYRQDFKMHEIQRMLRYRQKQASNRKSRA